MRWKGGKLKILNGTYGHVIHNFKEVDKDNQTQLNKQSFLGPL